MKNASHLLCTADNHERLIQSKRVFIKMLEKEEFKLIVRKLSINEGINEVTETEAKLAARIKREKLELLALIKNSNLKDDEVKKMRKKLLAEMKIYF
ncbi:Oidioi.mRNA.OKI2018_I69.chr1.g2312.t1.cds [Oikopleura dioica]|uniref:Oidioi.mRNA.OKI2018_I69.chr1.g2312.t1.cds n=1 Tax=Oikopleura dioica TaxID=34765 RepID=A0ABN7SU93_OIKDI|nr:Oidioi.mRNA.OKI2018_I69.chr1.g2312.t1.cds [Oikopleura dioica]